MRILFSATRTEYDGYRDLLPAALADIGISADIEHTLAPNSPETVDYIIYAPDSRMKDFTPFTNAKAVLNLWAGVENVVNNQTLTQPLARMVDPGLTNGMVEWCVGHTMRHHLGIDLDIAGQDGTWRPRVPPLAQDRPVTILGLGELGQATGSALAGLGFPVTGWSRSPKNIPGIACLSGDDGLSEALGTSQITILLLPLTGATENLLNADRLALLPKGAVLINPGRGPLIDDAALLEALNKGQLSHATLDVFREEPLPPGHLFWEHPNVTVTPHIASATRPASAVRVLAENIRRGEAGEPFLHVVDRAQGY